MTLDETINAAEAEAHDEREAERIVLKLLPMVRYVAGRVGLTLPAGRVEFDDLVSAGTIGLIAAVRKHTAKPEKDIERLARHRARGAMIDYLGKVDHLPKRQRALVSRLRSGAMTQEDNAEDALWLSHVAVVSGNDVAHVSGTVSPENAAMAKQRALRLKQAIRLLPSRQRDVIGGIYWDNQTPAEYAREKGRTRARISQLRGEAIARLRVIMGVGA